MNLQPDPFQMIQLGHKDIESRLYDEKRQLLKINDEIVFKNTETDEQPTARIKAIHIFEGWLTRLSTGVVSQLEIPSANHLRHKGKAKAVTPSLLYY